MINLQEKLLSEYNSYRKLYELDDQFHVVSRLSGKRVTGTKCGQGYKNIGTTLYHRVVHALYYCWLPPEIDHIDRDKWNCSPDNLRPATHAQNMANKGILSNNKTGFKGVQLSRTKAEGYTVTIGGIYLGTYSDPVQAGFAYDMALIAVFDEYAYTNTDMGKIRAVPIVLREIINEFFTTDEGKEYKQEIIDKCKEASEKRAMLLNKKAEA